jgi:glycine cleavage system pyridoxal-binding protein P
VSPTTISAPKLPGGVNKPKASDDDTAAVAVQYPNFYGSIEDLEKIHSFIEDKKAHCTIKVYFYNFKFFSSFNVSF